MSELRSPTSFRYSCILHFTMAPRGKYTQQFPRPLSPAFLILCGLSVGLFGCAPDRSDQPHLVYTLSKQPFIVSVKADGVLEAKRATTLTAPTLRKWRQLEITYLTPEGSSVEKDEVVVRFDPQPFENDHRTAYNALAIARADANKKQAELRAQQFMLEADRESANAAAAVSRLQLGRLEFVAPRLREIKRLEMERNELRSEKTSRKLASIAEILKEERAHADILIKQAERKLKEAEETIRKLSIRAPTAGIVIYERGWRAVKPQEGGAKYPGEAVVRIPDPSVMQVKVQVGEIQAQQLKEGQHAEVVISALRREPVTGRVARVAKRAVPLKKGSRVKQVEVIVELDSTTSAFKSGLSARARIFAERVPEALVAPLDCVFEQDSTYVVHVREGKRFTSRRVKLKARNSDYAVIEGNLEAGDELALRKPPR